MINIYYPKQYFDADARKEWMELLRSQDRYMRGGRAVEDIKLQENIRWADAPEGADIILLPMDWSYYYGHKQQKEVLQWANQWKDKKPVVSQSGGDMGISIPGNIWQFRPNAYASKYNAYQLVVPAFFSDPVTSVFFDTTITLNPYKEIPVVGFCGQSISTGGKRAKDILRTVYLNLQHDLGINYYDKHKIMSTSHLREKILRIIEKSSLQTNFIRREKYRAGAQTEEARKKTSLEYFKNQQDSDYTICVRGGGNFSVRFYETLAMGRIPVFVNTDCKLPLKNDIDWKQHVVWIEENEIEEISQRIQTFHSALGKIGFTDIQKRNRALWESSLTQSGYYLKVLRQLLKNRLAVQ